MESSTQALCLYILVLPVWEESFFMLQNGAHACLLIEKEEIVLHRGPCLINYVKVIARQNVSSTPDILVSLTAGQWVQNNQTQPHPPPYQCDTISLMSPQYMESLTEYGWRASWISAAPMVTSPSFETLRTDGGGKGGPLYPPMAKMEPSSNIGTDKGPFKPLGTICLELMVSSLGDLIRANRSKSHPRPTGCHFRSHRHRDGGEPGEVWGGNSHHKFWKSLRTTMERPRRHKEPIYGPLYVASYPLLLFSFLLFCFFHNINY